MPRQWSNAASGIELTPALVAWRIVAAETGQEAADPERTGRLADGFLARPSRAARATRRPGRLAGTVRLPFGVRTTILRIGRRPILRGPADIRRVASRSITSTGEVPGVVSREGMKSIGVERLGRWATVALAVLLFHNLMPGAARAGCGHLVSSRADRMLGPGRLDPLISGRSPAHDAGRSAPDRHEPSPGRPCSGPACSDGTPAPAPTPSSGVDRFHQYGILGVFEAFVATRARWIPATSGLAPAANLPPCSIPLAVRPVRLNR